MKKIPPNAVSTPLMCTSGLLLAATLGLSACATAPAQPIQDRIAERGYEIGEPVNDIQQFRIDGYNAIDARNLIVSGGPSRQYLVTLTYSCTSMPDVEQLAFTTTTSRLTTLDRVVVPPGPGRIQQNCPIQSIYELQRNRTAAD